MVFDEPVQDLIDNLGHDGSEIIFPNKVSPYCRRSFHIQEMYKLATLYGFHVMPIEKQLLLEVEGNIYEIKTDAEDFEEYIKTRVGVMGGTNAIGIPHAVAWYDGTVYDPGGALFEFDDFNTEIFYDIIQI